VTTARTLKFNEAIHEALDLCLGKDPSVYVIGLGVPDPKGIFGTTQGLVEKYGAARVMDMPTSENGMTGIALGSAVVGMRPVMTHQRVDFAVLALEQIVNQAAKWHYMFAGASKCPMVIRLIVGRGWGQGPQHSQSLQAWFAHVPGLKVVMPATPYDAKGLLVSSIEDDAPVVYLEHRWLHNTFGPVPDDVYRVPIGKARVMRPGRDVTIVAVSHMALEALQAADALAKAGIDAEVVDVRSLRPLDTDTILSSVRKTGHLIVADTGWKTGGFAGEVVALAAEHCLDRLKSPPRRLALLDVPTPSTPALAKHCYPRAVDLVLAAGEALGRKRDQLVLPPEPATPLDVPDSRFTGPF
jgi:pyruvate dehydrogenase E1 component beta subunit